MARSRYFYIGATLISSIGIVLMNEQINIVADRFDVTIAKSGIISRPNVHYRIYPRRQEWYRVTGLSIPIDGLSSSKPVAPSPVVATMDDCTAAVGHRDIAQVV